MRTEWKMAAATVAFAGVHSLLATRRAKDAAARAVGTRARAGYYRLFYNAQSVATFGALLAYGASLPRETVYRVRGPAAALLRAGQGASLGYLGWGMLHVDFPHFAGFTSAAAARAGHPLPPEPEAQSPAPDDDGVLRMTGPFAQSRHPMNAAFLAFFWLTPAMTSRRLGFNVVTAAYALAGSWLEDRRLASRWGPAFDAYRREVPFFLPSASAPRREHRPPVRYARGGEHERARSEAAPYA
jgi:protein-S-isoprenylcysteine O-methyltransferase Ste14